MKGIAVAKYKLMKNSYKHLHTKWLFVLLITVFIVNVQLQ